MAGKLTLQVARWTVADEMASGAIRACLRNRFKPISLAVLDASGHIVVQKRMDGCAPIGIPEFALAKAWTCISMKMSSRAFRQKYSSAEATPDQFGQMLSMVNISQGKMAPFPGGVLLRTRDDGAVIGAIGVSGASADEDEFCALSGVRYVAEFSEHCSIDPPRHSCSTATAGDWAV